MQGTLHIIAFVALAAVFIVLVIGVINMGRDKTGRRAQLLMRWRVALQFIAIVVMMAAVYFASR